jgi:predicted ATPase/DNA-binding SARP family transcriptional activator
VEFRILGPLEVWSGDRRVAVPGAAQRALLLALLLRANTPVSVDRLVDDLWGEDAGAGPVKRLQVGISRLRRALSTGTEGGDGPAVLDTESGAYVLRVGPEQVDATRFERLAGEGKRALAGGEGARAAATLREALGLWRGPALADVAFEPFAQAEIARLEELRQVALEDRIDADLARGGHREVVGELRAMVAEQPARERLRAQLMLALYRCGRQVEALDAYREAREWMAEELGLEPGPTLRRLQQAILRQERALEPRVSQPIALRLPAGRPMPGGPRAPAAPLFGREVELEELSALIREPATRLLTLTGPGGVGKTRLAVELARRVGGEFADGAHVVSLASVADARHLLSTIAGALGLEAVSDEEPGSTLLRLLSARHLLLVLDSFEHLLAGAPEVAELLGACPRVTVLATSREPLRLSVERVYALTPLTVPDDRAGVGVADLMRYGATAMFLDRARARDRAFKLAPAQVGHVLTICRRLDGLPLALELAAARLGVLSLEQLDARLGQSLAVLGQGPRDAPDRQATLRSTLDWSVDLLSAEERHAFIGFAVFAGAATLEAVEAVTGASLDVLDSLVAKHLVVRAGDRLAMLETTREYAAERLEKEPEAEAVRERHGRWCLKVAEDLAPRLVTSGRGRALSLLNHEIDNFRAALAWSVATGRGELAVALAGALGPYWWRANRDAEGRRWLDAALAVPFDVAPATRARALLFRARVNRRLPVPVQARDLSAAAELFASVGDRGGVAKSLAILAVAAGSQGDYAAARSHLDDALRIAREAGDADAVAMALSAEVMRAPDYRHASRLAEEAIPALEAVGNVVDICAVCSETGYLAIRDLRHGEALPWLERGLRAARQAGDPLGLHVVQSNQGLAHLFRGDSDHAARYFTRSLQLCREAALHDIVDEPLLGLAAVAVQDARLERAARLTGAARALGTGPHTLDEDLIFQRLHEQYLVPGRDRLGPSRWDQEERAGANLTVDAAINLALERIG